MLATLPYIDSSATADASIVNVEIIIFNMFVVFLILSQMWNLFFFFFLCVSGFLGVIIMILNISKKKN
jgi:hypothetical protein